MESRCYDDNLSTNKGYSGLHSWCLCDPAKNLVTRPQEDRSCWKWLEIVPCRFHDVKPCKVKKQSPKGRQQNWLHSPFTQKNTHTFLWRLQNRHKHRVHQNFGCQDTHFPVRAHQPQQGPRECLGYKHPGPVEKHQVWGRSVGSQRATNPPPVPEDIRWGDQAGPSAGICTKRSLVIPSLPWQVPACNFNKRVFQRHLACNYPTIFCKIKTKNIFKEIIPLISNKQTIVKQYIYMCVKSVTAWVSLFSKNIAGVCALTHHPCYNLLPFWRSKSFGFCTSNSCFD